MQFKSENIVFRVAASGAIFFYNNVLREQCNSEIFDISTIGPRAASVSDCFLPSPPFQYLVEKSIFSAIHIAFRALRPQRSARLSHFTFHREVSAFEMGTHTIFISMWSRGHVPPCPCRGHRRFSIRDSRFTVHDSRFSIADSRLPVCNRDVAAKTLAWNVQDHAQFIVQRLYKKE